jgi:predicted dehydrogenase
MVRGPRDDGSGDASDADPLDSGRPLRVGVLGAGNIGKVHAHSAAVMEGMELFAAADAVPENRRYMERLGARATYDDYAALLRTEPVDAVVVALPPFLHADAVELAARRGVHCFVEKPLARSVEEATGLLAAARDGGVSVGVDHTARYLPDVRQVHDAYRDGRIGAVPYATISRVNFGPFSRPPADGSLPEWHLDPDAAGGGALLELGVHLLDVLEWTFGDMEILHADLDAQLDIPVEDAATLLLRSNETDTRVTLHCGSYQWEAPSEFNMTFRLEGATGTLDSREYQPSSFYGQAVTAATENVCRRLTGRDPRYYAPTYYLQAYYVALREFLEAIREGTVPPVSGRDGLRTVELAEAAYDEATVERPTPAVSR